jgi:hypothetical protein
MRTLLTVAVAIVLAVMIGGIGIAAGQTVADESYWGEHTLNGFVGAWPAVAIGVLALLAAGALFGVYELNARSTVLLLATIAFLVYHFYLQPHAVINVLTGRGGRT